MAAEPLAGVSLEQAFQEGPQLRGEGLWEFHVLGEEKRTRFQRRTPGNRALMPNQT